METDNALADQVGSAVAVLDVGRDHRDAEKEANRIDDDIALDALGFLCRVVSDVPETTRPWWRIPGTQPNIFTAHTCPTTRRPRRLIVGQHQRCF